MTDINGVPVINTEAPKRPGLAIAQVPIELERGQSVVQLKLRAPGNIRAAAMWLATPKVLGSASMRGVEKIAHPVLFVECDPEGELVERVLLFLPNDVPFAPREGYAIRYVASAIAQQSIHVYEIVEVPS